MKHKNYFEYRAGVLQALESGGKNKSQIGAAMGISGASLSLHPGRKAIDDLVSEGKLLQQGHSYCLANAPIANRNGINANLQASLGQFLDSVIQVVGQNYDHQSQVAARNLSEAYARISELTQELATFKYEKSKLPNVLQKLQDRL